MDTLPCALETWRKAIQSSAPIAGLLVLAVAMAARYASRAVNDSQNRC